MRLESPTSPSALDTLMMRPHFLSFMPGTTARQHSQVPDADIHPDHGGGPGVGGGDLPVDLAAERHVPAAAFPQDAELSAGLLLDLGHAMSRSPRADVAVRGHDLLADLAHVAEPTASSGDAHRRRLRRSGRLRRE